MKFLITSTTSINSKLFRFHHIGRYFTFSSALSRFRPFSTLSLILPHFLPCFSFLSMFFLEPLFAYPPNLFIMDLVSWSLNTFDQIFPTGRQGKGEPSCPDRTFFSGYTMDSWQQWKIVCLTTMSVEDVKDLYIIGFLITGLLLFGVGGYL
ncbi:hypothetical protein ILYODFUR_021424, partial [Ilyodon furcidens]